MAVEDHATSLRQMKWLTGAQSRMLKTLNARARRRPGRRSKPTRCARRRRRRSNAAMERIRYGEMDDNGERSIPSSST